MKKLILIVLLLWTVNCFADESINSGEEFSPGIQMWLEEEDGSPSIVVYKTIVSDDTLADNADGTGTLTTGGESTTVSDTTTINLTLTGDDITADGLYTAGNSLTLTGKDFAVDDDFLKLGGDTATAGTYDFTGADLTVATPTASTEAATKEYVDLAVQSHELTEYFSATADALAGIYYIMDSTQAAAGTVSTGALTNGDNQLIFKFITPIASPALDTIFSGIYDSHIHIYKSGLTTGKVVTARWKMYQRVTAGTENLIMTSEDIVVTATSSAAPQIANPHAILASDFALTGDLSDRLVIYFEVDVSGGGVSVVFNIVVGGTVDSQVSVDIPLAELKQIFVEVAGDTMTGALTINDDDSGASTLFTIGDADDADSGYIYGGLTVVGTMAGGTLTEGGNAVSNDTEIEAVVEPLIDTLANLTSVQSFTVTLADAGANAFLGWDDTASAYENLTDAEALTIIGGAANDFDGSGDVTNDSHTHAAGNITGTDAGTDLTADLEEEVTEGSLADQTIVSGDIKDETIVAADIDDGAYNYNYTFDVSTGVLDDGQPPTISVIESTGTYTPRFRAAYFDDAVDDAVYFTFVAPSEMATGNWTLDVYWFSDETANEAVYWGADISATTEADADDVYEQAGDTTQVAGEVPDQTEATRLVKTTITISNLDSVEPGDLVTLRFYRDGDHASDLHTNEAYAITLRLGIPRT